MVAKLLFVAKRVIQNYGGRGFQTPMYEQCDFKCV